MTPRHSLAERMRYLHDTAMAHHSAAFVRGIIAGILALLGFVLHRALDGIAADIAVLAGAASAFVFVYQFGHMLGLAVVARIIRSFAEHDADGAADDEEWGPYR